jgi:prepilin-type N-terminal cleavage/methylation domain-containing protein
LSAVTLILKHDRQQADAAVVARKPVTSSIVPSDRGSPQSGFTLLELLVAIAVLSVLAGGAVLAVGSMKDHAQEVACSTDERALDTAQQALLATTGSAGDEALLVSSGYIKEPSEYHDIAVAGSEYKIIAVGPCISDGGGGGPVEIAGPADPEAPGPEAPGPEDKPEVTEPAKADPAKPDPAKPDPPEPEEAEKPDKEEKPDKPEKESETGCKKGQVDINGASHEELQKIKHIGEVRAKSVMELRPFKSVAELERVSGIGPRRLAEIQEQGVACVN